MSEQQEIIIKTENGKLCGKKSKDYDGNIFYSFQGIPYGKPPLGKLRFKPSIEVEPWEGILNATKVGNPSLSTIKTDESEDIVGSEDCLFLNVYAPIVSKELKPVIFLIHGGIFTHGSGGTEYFGPEYLMTENIILVTINYRLGVLGFLAFEDSKLGVSGNAGLKDALLGLKWVHNNIKYFNGDSNCITVVGFSSGAAMAHNLMLSSSAKGLFHRLILQSGSALAAWGITKSKPKDVAKELGCSDEDDENILNFLQSVSAEKLIETQFKLLEKSYISKMRNIGPVIEYNENNKEAVIVNHPVDIIKSGNYNKMPILIGYTSQEGIITEQTYGKQYISDFEKCKNFTLKIPHYYNIPANSKIAQKIADKIQDYYYNNSEQKKSNLEKFYTLHTDLFVLKESYDTIRYHLKNLNEPIYLYRLSLDTSLNFLKQAFNSTVKGACHGDEVGYLFRNMFTPEVKRNTNEEKYMRQMVRIWANFARNGNPNDENRIDALINVDWKPIKHNEFNYLDIDTKLSVGLNEDIKRMDVWNDITLMNTYKSKFSVE